MNHNVFHPFELIFQQLHFLVQLPRKKKKKIYFIKNFRLNKPNVVFLNIYAIHNVFYLLLHTMVLFHHLFVVYLKFVLHNKDVQNLNLHQDQFLMMFELIDHYLDLLINVDNNHFLDDIQLNVIVWH